MTYYVQCKLRKPSADGLATEEVAYIPSPFATCGQALRIRVHGLWTQPWLVIERYGQPIPEDHLPNAHAQIRLHVKNTGDTEKKRRQPAHQKSR